jgi:hypothetical protein
LALVGLAKMSSNVRWCFRFMPEWYRYLVP